MDLRCPTDRNDKGSIVYMRTNHTELSMSNLVEIHQHGDGRSLKITASSMLDRATARLVLKQLDEQMRQSGGDGRPAPIDAVRVDFARVDRIASEGINGLMQINRRAHPFEIPVVLCNVADRIRDVLRITRVDRVLHFENEPAPNLAAVSESFR